MIIFKQHILLDFENWQLDFDKNPPAGLEIPFYYKEMVVGF